MKKIFGALECILCLLTALLPLGTLIFSCLGYAFEIVSISAYAMVTASISVCIVALSIIAKEATESSFIRVMLAIQAPLSLIDAALCIFECSSVWVAACAFIFVASSLFLATKYGRPAALKTTALALSILMALPICLLAFAMLTFGNMGHNTVVKSIESPNGAYYAQIIDSDQGALGGDTLVDVYESKELNALAFKISKKPQRIYQGEWGEFENMEIYWKNNNCLVINAVEYEIE